MTRDRAIELVKWGMHYAKPRPKNTAEYRQAIEFVAAHPDTWEEIRWTPTSTAT